MVLPADLPDSALIPAGWVRQHYIPKLDSAERDISAAEAAELLGHSANWWQDRCRAGDIAGSYQARIGSKWYMPLANAKLFLQEYKETKSRRNRGRRRRAQAS